MWTWLFCLSRGLTKRGCCWLAGVLVGWLTWQCMWLLLAAAVGATAHTDATGRVSMKKGGESHDLKGVAQTRNTKTPTQGLLMHEWTHEAWATFMCSLGPKNSWRGGRPDRSFPLVGLKSARRNTVSNIVEWETIFLLHGDWLQHQRPLHSK